MKKKSQKILFFISLVMLIAGFIMWVTAQMEISSNARYTWQKPYSTYEAQIILIKWIGILFFICGLLDVGAALFKIIYTNKHTHEVSGIDRQGGVTQCLKCGLAITGNVRRCPRCGTISNRAEASAATGNSARFCQYCGHALLPGGAFCAGCGRKIM